MSNVTANFVQAPLTFLDTNVVQVSNAAQLGKFNSSGVRFVYFWQIAANKVSLKECKESDQQDKIKAYWLPWLTKDVTTLDLSGDADYLFTSQMTDCRFTVLSNDSGPVKVAHLAGTLGKGGRNTKQTELIKEMGGPENVRARSLSTSGSTGKTPEHQYTGQRIDNPGSAFVFGLRDTNANTWSFHAQIVKAALIEGFNLKTAPTPDIVTPHFVF